MNVVRRAHIFRDQRIKILGVEFRRAGLFQLDILCMSVVVAEVAHDVAHDRERVFVILRQMIDHAGFLRMQVAAAEILGADFLARGRLHQRWPGEEDRALIAHDYRLVGHGGHIGSTGSARSHHAGNLRNAERRHVRLIEEDAAEMVAVGKDLGLVGKVRPAAVDQIDTGQAVFLRDLLRTQVLLHRHRVIGTALNGGIVAHDHHLAAGDTPDPGNQARAIDLVLAIHAIGGKLADFEEGTAGIEQALHALAREKLAPPDMPFPATFRTAQRSGGNAGPQVGRERRIVCKTRLGLGSFAIESGHKNGGGHAVSFWGVSAMRASGPIHGRANSPYCRVSSSGCGKSRISSVRGCNFPGTLLRREYTGDPQRPQNARAGLPHGHSPSRSGTSTAACLGSIIVTARCNQIAIDADDVDDEQTDILPADSFCILFQESPRNQGDRTGDE